MTVPCQKCQIWHFWHNHNSEGYPRTSYFWINQKATWIFFIFGEKVWFSTSYPPQKKINTTLLKVCQIAIYVKNDTEKCQNWPKKMSKELKLTICVKIESPSVSKLTLFKFSCVNFDTFLCQFWQFWKKWLFGVLLEE